MWARVSTYQLPADDVGAAAERFSEALDQFEAPGLRRAELLIDRASGKALSITVWDDEQALEASAKAANQIRSDAANAASVSIVDVTN